MPKSLLGFKDVPSYDTIAESVRDGRRIVFVLGGDSTCCKLSIDKGGRKSTEASVLY